MKNIFYSTHQHKQPLLTSIQQLNQLKSHDFYKHTQQNLIVLSSKWIPFETLFLDLFRSDKPAPGERAVGGLSQARRLVGPSLYRHFRPPHHRPGQRSCERATQTEYGQPRRLFDQVIFLFEY